MIIIKITERNQYFKILSEDYAYFILMALNNSIEFRSLLKKYILKIDLYFIYNSQINHQANLMKKYQNCLFLYFQNH
jgi:hypothetical protein